MPNAKDYAPLKIHQGPGDLWIIGTAPVDGTQRLTLGAGGIPDDIAHPNSVHLGAIAEGITTIVTQKNEPVTADNFEAPIEAVHVGLEMKIEAVLKQAVHDITKLQYLLPKAVYSTAAGYKQITLGGGSPTVPFVSVAMISPTKADVTKFVVTCLYKAYAMSSPSLEVGRTKPSVAKAEFMGVLDLARTAGRQLGIVYATE